MGEAAGRRPMMMGDSWETEAGDTAAAPTRR
jgi:hypothetical protein